MSLKFTLGLIVGATAGAAIVHFLNTSEGKAFARKIKDDAEEVEDNLANLAEDLISKGRTFVNEFGNSNAG